MRGSSAQALRQVQAQPEDEGREGEQEIEGNHAGHVSARGGSGGEPIQLGSKFPLSRLLQLDCTGFCCALS